MLYQRITDPGITDRATRLMQFVFRSDVAHPRKVAVFPGACNPPTVAHAAVAEQGLRHWADEVVWVMPRVFPHKKYEGPTLEERIAMVLEIAHSRPGQSVAVSEGGLYAEIAAEAQEVYGTDAEVGLLCGRDAAERMAKWNYDRPGVFEEMVARHPLIVASRLGHFDGAAVQLPMGEDFEEVSSTEVRRRIAEGLPWESLVPSEVRNLVRRFYR